MLWVVHPHFFNKFFFGYTNNTYKLQIFTPLQSIFFKKQKNIHRNNIHSKTTFAGSASINIPRNIKQKSSFLQYYVFAPSLMMQQTLISNYSLTQTVLRSSPFFSQMALSYTLWQVRNKSKISKFLTKYLPKPYKINTS